MPVRRAHVLHDEREERVALAAAAALTHAADALDGAVGEHVGAERVHCGPHAREGLEPRVLRSVVNFLQRNEQGNRVYL